MKIVFVGIVLIAATLTANATGLGGTRTVENTSPSVAQPMCPPGQIRAVIRVVNGYPIYGCVPVN